MSPGTFPIRRTMLPNPSPELSARIRKAFEEGTPIDRAVEAAIRDAIASNKTAQRSRRKARSKKKSA